MFGLLAETMHIDIDAHESEANVIDLIAENSGPRLKQIELCAFHVEGQLHSLRPMFGDARAIKLMCCGGSAYLDSLLAVCIHLRSLTLHNCYKHTFYAVNQSFPALDNFSMYRTELDDASFERFIGRHSNLTTISIEESMGFGALRTIGLHAHNLRQL